MKKSLLLTLLTAPALMLGVTHAGTSSDLPNVPFNEIIKRASMPSIIPDDFGPFIDCGFTPYTDYKDCDWFVDGGEVLNIPTFFGDELQWTSELFGYGRFIFLEFVAPSDIWFDGVYISEAGSEFSGDKPLAFLIDGNDYLSYGTEQHGSRTLYVAVNESVSKLAFAVPSDEEHADPVPFVKVRAIRCNDFAYDKILIDGGTKNIYVDVDKAYTQEQIVSEVSAQDLFGVAVPVTVKSSDYKVGQTGTFNIILEATDKYGQKASATLIVNVLDYAKPTIVKKNEVQYTYGTVLTESMLLENFTFSDNMGAAGLTYSFTYPTGFDITKPLVFGNYSLTVTATDSFNNSESLDFVLSVIDTTAPTISKKDGQMSDKVGIGYSALNENTVAWILNLYKAVDIIDGNCDVYLKDGKIPTFMAGDFTLTIAAKDKSGNEAIATITCEIIADIPPVFILSDKLVNSTVDNPLLLEDLVRLIKNGLLRSRNVDNIIVNASGYLANSTTVGNYPVSYSYTDLDTAETKTDSFIMKVSDNSELPVEEPSNNWFTDAFKAVFSKNIDKATATNWIVVIGTFVLGIGLIILLVNLFKPEPKKTSKNKKTTKRR